MKQIRFTLLFVLLASVTLAQSVRLYPVGTDRVIADGATGVVQFIKPSTDVSLSAKDPLVVQLAVNGVLFGKYLPANFLKQDGTAYSSASVAASVQAYKDAVSAASSGGGSASIDTATTVATKQFVTPKFAAKLDATIYNTNRGTDQAATTAAATAASAAATAANSATLTLSNQKIFNVVDYGGAVGNGTTDDRVSIQNTINAAIAQKGKVYFPFRASGYKSSDMLVVQPSSGTEVYLDMEAQGVPRNLINYTGNSGTVAIRAIGLRFSTWIGIKVNLPTSTTGIVAFDLDTQGSSSSTSFDTFINCHVAMNASNQEAWRVGHLSQNGGDLSDLNWITCSAYGTYPTHTGQIGWHIEGSNTLANGGANIFTAFCDRGYSNKSGPGASGSGNGSFTVQGWFTSQNNEDIEIANSQSYSFFGGRCESGKQVLNVQNSNVSPSITFVGVEINDYAGDGIGSLFYLDMPCSLMLLNINIKAGTHSAYGSNMIKEGGGGTGTRFGRVFIEGGAIEAATPFRSDYANGTTWKHYIRGVAQINSAGVAIAMFPDEGGSDIADIQATNTAQDNKITSLSVTANSVVINSILEYFGDSITQFGSNTSGSTTSYSDRGFPAMASFLSGDRYTVVNLGVGGNTTSDMAARLAPALAAKPRVVVILGGANDHIASASAATITTNLDIIYQAFKAIGCKVIAITTLPSYNSYTLTTGNEAIRQTVRSYIKSYPGIVAIDSDPIMSSSAYYSDGLHPNAVGSYVLGNAVAPYLLQYIDNNSIAGVIVPGMGYTAGTLMTGTSGSKTIATGNVATSWTLDATNSGGATIVASKAADDKQVITLSGTYTGTGRVVEFFQSYTATLPVAGDILEGLLDYEITSALTNVVSVHMQVQVYTSGFATLLSNQFGLSSYDAATAIQYPLGRYTDRTAPIAISAGTPAIVVNRVRIVLKDGGGSAAGAVKLYRAGVRKL